MKKSVLSAAMLLALGVSGAANAVQMHGVVMGELVGTSSFDKDRDGALDVKVKTWGVNSAPQAEKPIQIDFWFDSGLISRYVDGGVSQTFRKYFSPDDVTVAATFNGVTRQISSQRSWEFADSEMGKSLTPMKQYDLTSISVSELNNPARSFSLNLTFADGSIPLLKEIMLGTSVFSDAKSTQLKMLPSTLTSQFSYHGTVDGKTYESTLFYKPMSFAIAPVPEPETWAMMLLGLGVVGYAARRRAAG